MDRRIILTVARREATEIARDGRFRWAAGLLLGILIASFAASVHRTHELRVLRDRAQQEERERWLAKGKMLPHPAMHFGFYVFQPYHDLAALDSGVTPYAGAYTLLEAHEQTLFQDRPAADEVPTRWLTALTPALCLQVLVPLLIIAMAFGTYVGERERGTWRQVLSTGVGASEVCIGKALGVVTPLLVLLLPAAGLGSLVLLLHSSTTLRDMTARLAILVGAYAVFFAIVLSLTLGVSMMARSSRQALMILVTFWFTTTLVVPFLAGDIGSALYPSPTSFEYAADILKAKNAKHYPTAREVVAELLAIYRVTSREQLPVSPEGIHLLKQQKIDDPIYDAALGRLYDTYRSQDWVTRVAGLAAPPLAMQSISMALGEADVEAHLYFAEHAGRYRHRMETMLDEDAAFNLTPGPRDRRLWEKIPPFVYVPRALSSILAHCTLTILALGLWSVAALGGLRWSSTRMVS
jgi:ABC-2 type transport system permease protein